MDLFVVSQQLLGPFLGVLHGGGQEIRLQLAAAVDLLAIPAVQAVDPADPRLLAVIAFAAKLFIVGGILVDVYKRQGRIRP